MARMVRRHLRAWSQPVDVEEPKTNCSAPQQEEQADTIDGEVIANYEQGVDYEPEMLEPETSQMLKKKKKNLMLNM